MDSSDDHETRIETIRTKTKNATELFFRSSSLRLRFDLRRRKNLKTKQMSSDSMTAPRKKSSTHQEYSGPDSLPQASGQREHCFGQSG